MKSRLESDERGVINLVKYDAACRALAECKSVDEVKNIRDRAVAMAAYAKQAKNKNLEADSAEIRMRAERRLGELIKAQKATVGFPSGGERGGRKRKDGSRAEPSIVRPSLADAGIDKKLSSRAQQLAALSAKRFEKAVSDAREAVNRAVRSVVRGICIEQERKSYSRSIKDGGVVSDLRELIADGKRFSVIYADPPWSHPVYGGKGQVYSSKGHQRSAERYYDTQSVEAIMEMPVEALAADDCALFLWSVMPQLPGALKVIERWGFQYVTAAFVWVKQNSSGQGLFTGMGWWTRANAEVCLLAKRGSPRRIAKDVHQIVLSSTSEHSHKPEEVRRRIERLSAGPYLELYSRTKTHGWTCWGNEIER